MSVLELVEPRIRSVPAYVSSAGQEAVELAALAGLYLDGWQADVLREAMGERADGKWAARDVGVNAPRQNGKDAILEARELAGLFLLGERLIVHSSHMFATSREHFLRLVFLIENTPDFSRRVKAVWRASGNEGIELVNGQRIVFKTRTAGGGRGFTGDLCVFNEAMILSEEALGALLPTLSARPNPQIWFAGSAADQIVQPDSIVWARVRARAQAGDDRLAYFEWSAPFDHPDQVDNADDPEVWAAANPALGIRISEENVEAERRAMDDRTFAVERLGVGDYPRIDGHARGVIAPEAWDQLADDTSKLLDPVCLFYDIAPDRSSAAISAAGRNAAGLWHVEVIDHRRGTGWVAERFLQLVDKHEPAVKGCDAYAMLPELEREGLVVVNAPEHAHACARFVDAVEQKTLRHLGSAELRSAVRGARTRPMGDSAWAWSRKGSLTDITPLVSASLALSAAIDQPEAGEIHVW